MTTEPLIVHPNEGVTIPLGTSNLTIKLDAATTGERFALLEYDVAPNFVPPQVPHGHTKESQTIYLLEGELRFEFKDRTVDVATGTVLHIPENATFTWRNCTSSRARMLYIFAPAGLEQYFVDVQDVFKARSGSTPADIAPYVEALWTQYGIFSDPHEDE
ncbi:cupin domain-containing protein [Phaeobacter marinintestinus]|uniref:cupin domain-containing protein n=1 Tax=Falsiphaeobacter marinintestinus TaxID=1492905 RepID=UPI0011B5D68A|nr:cupin domain-containing protein [Phaeobacter marinintestinus]